MGEVKSLDPVLSGAVIPYNLSKKSYEVNGDVLKKNKNPLGNLNREGENGQLKKTISNKEISNMRGKEPLRAKELQDAGAKQSKARSIKIDKSKEKSRENKSLERLSVKKTQIRRSKLSGY